MLSICIPIYNFDARDLVTKLYSQVQRLGFSCQIICIDDGSEKKYSEINREKCSQYGEYIVLEKNIGRAGIRNLFLEYVKYDYLLFLDCDSIIISDDFIWRYAEAINRRDGQVICGGRVYGDKDPGRQKKLRWKYGHLKESMPVSVRRCNPNQSFMTNNFVINKALFSRIRFDERLLNYGHEDTLFGYRLKSNGIQIFHIDNPVLNGDLEINSEFLTKTAQGLKNLVFILNELKNDPVFVEEVTILNFFNHCRKKHLTGIIIFTFNVFQPLIRFFLIEGVANLRLFDFYKLGYFSKEYEKFRKDHSFIG